MPNTVSYFRCKLFAHIIKILLHTNKYNDSFRYVAIISGISLGDPQYDPMPLQLFVDLVTGQLGSLKDQTFYSKVVRLIVAGDSLSKHTRDSTSAKQAKYLTTKTKAASISAAQELDDVLTQLVSCIFVDLMPGQFDPASFSLPQQPLHRCIFPQVSVKLPFINNASRISFRSYCG